MKNALLTLTIVLAFCTQAWAANRYWDRNGSTAGSGNTGGVWDTTSNNWNNNMNGTGSTMTFGTGDKVFFSAGTDGIGNITITGNASPGDMEIEEGTVEFTGIITMGSNSIDVDSGATLVTNNSARISTSAGSQITLNGGTWRSINPAAGSFVDSDSTISLSGGGIIDYTIANVLSTIQSTTVISGSGGLTKNGVGVIALASASTYSGGTTINGGELRISGANDRLPTTGNVTVNASGILNLNDRNQTIGTLSGSGQVGLGSGTLTISSANNATFSGAIKDTANAGASGSTNTGGKLVKSGAGTQTLSGANTYTGGTTLNGGTLSLGSSGAIGTTGTIGFGGGTLQFSGSNTTDYSARFSNAASQAYSLDTNGQSVTLATALTSSGGTLTKLGAGTLTLTAANTYSGATTISAGTLSIGNGGTTGSVADGITNNASLIFNRSNALTHSGNISGTGTLTKQGADVLTLSGANSYSGGTTLSAGTLALGSGGAIGTTGTIDFGGGTLRFSGSNTTDYSARFSNAGSQAYSLDTNSQSVTLATALTSSGGTLTKLGAGTLTTTGANTYSGMTTISAGTLSVGNGGTSGSIAGDITNNAVLDFNRSNDTSYSGPISGTGVVNKRGTGNLTLSGNNSHAGGTTQYDGGLKLGHKNALGFGTYTIGDATTSTMLKVSSTTNLTGANAVGNAVTVVKDFTVDSGSSDLELSGGVNLGAVNRTVTVDSSNLTKVSGVVGDGGSGTGALTKAGAGVLTLTGANTYGGGTTVSAGTLMVNNTTGSGTGSGSVLVASGATLGGTGAITGAVTVNGTYSPGASIETMDTGSLAFGSGSTFTYELNSNLALAVAADLVNAAGALTINPLTVLSITDFGSTKLAYGTKFTLISYSGSWVQPPGHPQPNHFAGLPNGSSFTLGLNQWNIRYDDPNGGVNFGGGNFTNHVTISAVPEASMFIVIGLGGIFAFAAVRMGKRMGVNVLKV